jgi:hypothetical protein
LTPIRDANFRIIAARGSDVEEKQTAHAVFS